MEYELRLAATASGVGYFSSLPKTEATFDEHLTYLRACPLDDFMHRHLLEMLGQLDEERGRRIFELARGRDEVVMALLCEAALTRDHLGPLKELFDADLCRGLLPHTPLLVIKSALIEDRAVHAGWMRCFERNLSLLEPLPGPAEVTLPSPFNREGLLAAVREGPSLEEIRRRLLPEGVVPGKRLASARETAERALKGLENIGILASEELAHQSSLSPYGFLRKWHLKVSVGNRRHDYTLTGVQTSYGKGLTEDGARASYAMEIVERCSSFASVDRDGLIGFTNPYPLAYGTHQEMRETGRDVLDPNALRLEAPYAGEPLHWVEARQRLNGDLRPILIPVQAVFLFCNLDEVSLFSALGSTGLASGNTLEEARVSALLEVIERDCEATSPFHPSRCFRLVSDDLEVGGLLADYEARSIQVRFQDITHELGVPCYKCIVLGPRGGVVKGTGAHLDGRRAILSALTETPYPYPKGPPSAPGPENLKTIRFEDLPRHGTDDATTDLAILEALLAAHGHRPIYMDLTRGDVTIPVVKAIVPGLELSADFDSTSRVSPRLFANYLRTVGAL
jgi:ribosomal protein S12 methylthiotransferase accessory factor YcaO